MTAPTPRPSTVAHLDAMVATLPAGSGVALSTRRPGERLRRGSDRLVTSDNVDQAARWVALESLVADVYVSCGAFMPDAWAGVVARSREARGRADEVGALDALWADLDVAGQGHAADALPPDAGAVLRILAALPPFSLLIWTGGGFHVWWLLRDPFVIADQHDRRRAAAAADGWVRTVAKVAHDLGGWSTDAGVGDLGRVLRIAGTSNHKTGTPRPVELADVGGWPAGLVDARPWRPGTVYDLAQLEDRIDPLQKVHPTRSTSVETKSPAVDRLTRGSHRPTSDGPGVLDALGVLPWADVWPADWTYVGEETIGGERVELWRRPGASHPTSAKCWPGGGCRVWSDQVPGLPAGDYSRADVYAWRYGITVAELAREVHRVGRERSTDRGLRAMGVRR